MHFIQKSSNQWLSKTLPETHDELATTYCFGRLVPLSFIANPDLETGNGSRVKHVEERDHWPPVDLSFAGVKNAGLMIHVIYAL